MHEAPQPVPSIYETAQQHTATLEQQRTTLHAKRQTLTDAQSQLQRDAAAVILDGATGNGSATHGHLTRLQGDIDILNMALSQLETRITDAQHAETLARVDECRAECVRLFAEAAHVTEQARPHRDALQRILGTDGQREHYLAQRAIGYMHQSEYLTERLPDDVRAMLQHRLDYAPTPADKAFHAAVNPTHPAPDTWPKESEQ